MRVVRPTLGEGVAVLGVVAGEGFRRVQQVEQGLVGVEVLLERHDGLLVGVALGDALDLVVTSGEGRGELVALAALDLPGGLEVLPGDRGAVVPGGLVVDREDNGLRAVGGLLDLGHVVGVRLDVLQGTIRRVLPDARHVEAPQAAHVHGVAVDVNGVPVRADLGDRQGEGATLLQLAAILRVVVGLARIRHRERTGVVGGNTFLRFGSGLGAVVAGAAVVAVAASTKRQKRGCSGGEGGDLTRGRCKTHTLHSSPEQHELRVPFSPSKYLATRTVMIHHVLLTLASLFTFRRNQCNRAGHMTGPKDFRTARIRRSHPAGSDRRIRSLSGHPTSKPGVSSRTSSAARE